jgi:hypothetical protein
VVAAFAALAAWRKNPALLAGGPIGYGFSWVVFLAGLALLGSYSLKNGKVLGLHMLRRFAERFLVE